MNTAEPAKAAGQARLLIVDDEASHVEALRNTLGEQGYLVTGHTSAAAALASLREQRFDLLLTDLMMPEMSGIDLLSSALAIDSEMIGILMTGHGTIDSAVRAMQVGAFDYILKPFKLSVILPVIARSLSVRTLRLEKADLQRQVLARTAELESANRELESFSYTVAHDLRTPLRTIQGFTQIIIDESSAALTEDARENLQRVSQGARRMRQLIDDLLSLARLGRQAMATEAVDLSAIAHEVVELLRAGDPGRQVAVEIAPDLRHQGDSGLLRIVFENLLGNAWKFTTRTPAARITVGSERQGQDQVVHIRDNGAGFDQKRAAQLFRPFRRLHTESDFPGTGIGLATVHRIIERHGGRIWAEGVVGSGATFFIALPDTPA